MSKTNNYDYKVVKLHESGDGLAELALALADGWYVYDKTILGNYAFYVLRKAKDDL